MGDIIIEDKTLGRSYNFTPTSEGYFRAQAKIQEIVQQGHQVAGDISRVMSYTGGSY